MSLGVGSKVKRLDNGVTGEVTGVRTADNGQINSVIVHWDKGTVQDSEIAHTAVAEVV